MSSISGCDLNLARASGYTKLHLMQKRLKSMVEFWNENLSGKLIDDLKAAVQSVSAKLDLIENHLSTKAKGRTSVESIEDF
jgi:hypothetical protein